MKKPCRFIYYRKYILQIPQPSQRNVRNYSIYLRSFLRHPVLLLFFPRLVFYHTYIYITLFRYFLGYKNVYLARMHCVACCWVEQQSSISRSYFVFERPFIAKKIISHSLSLYLSFFINFSNFLSLSRTHFISLSLSSILSSPQEPFMCKNLRAL